MKDFKTNFILRSIQPPHKAVTPVVIAVLDTGVCIDENDTMLCAGAERRISSDFSRNYFNPKDSWEGWDSDNNGHGTHVVRILLQNTVSAKIIVLKVAEDRTMEYTPTMFNRFIAV